MPRRNLTVKISELNSLKSSFSGDVWDSNRKKILEKHGYTCCYCGTMFHKYLICINLNNEDNNSIIELELSCRACFLITHINFGFNDEIELYYSELKQVDIVKKTIVYINEHNKIPFPQDLDENAQKISLSIAEYVFLIKSGKSISDSDKFKIFFTQSFNTHFIHANNTGKKPLFINDDGSDEYNDEYDDQNSDSINSNPVYEFKKSEELKIKNILSFNDYENYMNDIIQRCETQMISPK